MNSDNCAFIEFDVWESEHQMKFGRFLSIAVQIKHHGKWRVHKNDADKHFPSDFHADRVDKPEKLDLYTGDVFSKTTHERVYRMKEKEMRKIYSDLEKSGESFLKDKLSQRENFPYLNN